MKNMEKSKKIEYFEFFLEKLFQSCSNNNDFSIVKTQKLLYFLCNSIKDEHDAYPLFDIFNNFYALPYGHVEYDTYAATRDNNLKFFEVNRFGMIRKTTGLRISISSDDYTAKIDSAFDNLKKTSLPLKSSSYLVDLSHCHESWIVNYRLAQSENKLNHKIEKSALNSESKYFSL
jgi:uncharacterized phage-associated protein